MSVYKRPGAETFSYDFECGGVRFSGDTRQTQKREAIRVQGLERVKAKAEQKARAVSANADMTLEAAIVRYWNEVGDFHVNKLETGASLDWLKKYLGGSTLLKDIDDNRIAALVAKRRGQMRQVGKKAERKTKVGPATVNRTMTEPLRKVMVRARKIWKVPVQEIQWSEHLLAEPRERVREASIGEEAAIMAQLGRGYDIAVAFAMLSGCRRGEILGLVWNRVDFFGRQFTVIGKGGHLRTIPMSDEIFALLWSQKDMHPVSVFTYTAARTDARKKLEAGKVYVMTAAGLKTAMRRAVPKAEVENFRFHDTRHTAATRVLRVSNLRVVQILLGHRDVATTAKYAHAQVEDLRAALNAASPTKSPTTSNAEGAKVRK